MKPSDKTGFKANVFPRLKKAFFLIFVSSYFPAVLLGQGPLWITGAPAVTSVNSTAITLNYGLDRTGTVYFAVWNTNFTYPYTPAQIKSIAQKTPGDSLVATRIIAINTGNINTVQQVTIDVTSANRTHTIYIVAESSAGILQASPVKLPATTLPCPKIDVLTGFMQPVTCVNKGTTATFMVVATDNNPQISGITKGTVWTLDWGDGSNSTFTSSTDNELPPLTTRTHTYTSVSDCNYIFTNRITNPCGESRAVQYIAVIHGRDIPADGDGVLRIVDNASGNSVIRVCEGTQSVITLRDNSVWNCQNPVLPGGLTPVPNSDPRNIEWLYGRDPSGAIYNTITGSVTIATLGNAPQSSGRMLPTPYGPSSLSQAITIPATCKAGEYFRVWLKNWNKCNWADPDFVSAYVDVNVVAVPPAPAAPDKTICFGGNRTLTVTSTPTGQIRWYSDPGLTTLAGTGATYTPSQTPAGSYIFWVVDKSTSGLNCQSAATQVTLTINQIPLKPSINHPVKNDICYDGGITTYTMTAIPAAPPVVTSYQWYKDGVAIPEATSQTIVLSQPSHTGSYTVSTIGVAPSNCPGPQSDPWYVTVHTLSNLTNPVPITVCQNETATFSAFTTDEVQNWQWEVSTNGGTSFTTVPNGPPYNGFNTINLTITNPPPSFNGNLYRVEIKTPPGQGGCAFKSNAAMLTVKELTTANAGPDQSLCGTLSTTFAGNSPLPNTGTWTMISGPGIATFSPNANNPSATVTVSNFGTYVFRWTITNGSSCISSKTVTISYNETGQVNRPPDIMVCNGEMTMPVNFTTTNTGGITTYNWINNNPATGLPASGTGSIPSFEANNTGTFPVTSIVTVLPVYINGASSCPGPAEIFTITVNPTPKLISPLTMPDVCSNTVINYVPISLIPGTTFNWTRGAISGILPGSPGSGVNNPDEILRNMTSAPVNVTYHYFLMANGCYSYEPVNVVVNPEPGLNFTITEVACNNASSGSINLTVEGTGPFTFKWIGPDNFSAGSEDLSGLKAGLYQVTVTDIKGCSSESSVNLGQSMPLNASISSRNISCFRSDDGAIYINSPAGGSGRYEYTIDGGTTWRASGNFEGLIPGTYDVRIRDGQHNECFSILNNALSVLSPQVISASVTSGNVTCMGANNGQILISSQSGGSGNYQYSVNGGSSWQSSGLFNGLAPGIYNVMIRDALYLSCAVVLNSSLVISEPARLSAALSSTNGSCYGSNDGTITIASSTGGSGIYEFTINGGISWQRSGNFINLEPGTYDVRIRDASFPFCSTIINSSVSITQPASLSANVLFTNVSCKGRDDGTISITQPSGGQGSYEYSINGGLTWASSSLFTELKPSTYDVRIRDAVNPFCMVILDQEVKVDGQADFSSALNPAPICSGSVFNYTPFSTVANATFEWIRPVVDGISGNGSSGTGNITEVLTNTSGSPVKALYIYTMNVNGCISSCIVNVTVNPNPVVSFSGNNSLKMNKNESVVLHGTVTGGSGVWMQHIWTGNVLFLSDNTVQSPTFGPDKSGSYSLIYKVVDNLGCSGADSIIIDVSETTGIEIPSVSLIKCSVYPNPVIDFMVLELDNFYDGANEINYSIFDAKGVLFENKKIVERKTYVNMEKLYPGTYLVRVAQGTKILGIKKIIKEWNY